MDLREQLANTLGDGYAIERELGGGGMSRVFVAREVALDRRVVVKVLPPEMAAELSAARFKREIEVSARLQHPHIVPTLITGDSAGLPFYTMPLVEGETLRARLERVGELPVADAVHLLRDVATALEFAHEHGVVHRDIKPENILLTKHNAVVTDFGIAKAVAAALPAGGTTLTGAGIAIGTPMYMAPEQAAADPACDHRVDLYALGAVAYEMLCGTPPFAGRTTQALLAAHASLDPEPLVRRRPTVPPVLAALVHRLLAKRPADRPRDAEEVLAILDAVAVSAPASATPVARPWRHRPAMIAAAAVITLIAVGFKWWRVHTVGAIALRSVAVMPFDNLSADTTDVFFAEGMAEELINALGHVGLTVSGRTSAFRLARDQASARDIGRALSVGTMVRGTVQRAAGQLRVTASLIRTADDEVLWSEHYVRPSGDVFKLQDELARAIASELRVRLAPETTGSVGGGALTTSLAAYDLYLRAHALWVKRGGPSLDTAIALYTEAIALDSTFLRAYAGRALCYVVLQDYDVAAVFDSNMARAGRDASHVLERSPQDPDARLALAHVRALLGYWSDGAEGYRQVLAWDPSNVTAHLWYGMMLRDMGRLDESLAEERIAVERDPLSQVAGWQLGLSLITSGRVEEALAVNRRNVAIDSTSVNANANLGYAFLHGAGQLDSATYYYDRARRLNPQAAIWRVGLLEVAARAGRMSEARRGLDALRQSLPASQRNSYPGFSEVYAQVGEADSSFAWLRRGATHAQRGWVEGLGPCLPVFNGLRRDPRWGTLLTQIGVTGCRELVP